MSFSARERAMLSQYERAVAQLVQNVEKWGADEGSDPQLQWWEDEATFALTLQCQLMHAQLPDAYKRAMSE